MCKALLLMLVLGCGGAGSAMPQHLTGPVSLRFVWEGQWSTTDRFYLETFATGGLAEIGYFKYLDPALSYVLDASATHVVHMMGPGATAAGNCGWHTPAGEIFIASPCATWSDSMVTRALSHELVELAADPNVTDNDHELADQCNNGQVPFTILFRQVEVATYMIAGDCVPH